MGQSSKLRSAQVVHDAGAEGVANYVHSGSAAVPENVKESFSRVFMTL